MSGTDYTAISPPPPPGRPGGLGEKLEITLQRTTAFVLNLVHDALVNILAAGVELVLEVIEQSAANRLGPVIDDALQNADMPDSIKSYLQGLRNPSHQSDALGLGGIASQVGMSAASGLMAPVMRMLNYSIDSSVRSARADPNVMWAAYRRDLVSAGDLYGVLGQLGWDDTSIAVWGELLKSRASEVDLIRDWLRRDQSAPHPMTEMQKRGFGDDDIAAILRLAQLIPGPADLIGMAVRGAFSPDEIAQFGLASELPTDFVTWMKRQGFSDEWAARYWYSHWNLPSLQAGYEMLHRGVIDETVLDLLLQAQDVSPYWRDKLKDISYQPLTRVDVRRMYGLGVLGVEDVYKSYRDLGYNHENAQSMTEFTVAYETSNERDLTKADILGGFKEGMLSDTEASTLLQGLGYDENEAVFLVAREAAKLARDYIDKQLDAIEDLYVNGDISQVEAINRMTQLGLASSEIDQKITLWTLDRERKTKRPSQSQLDSFLRRDIVDVTEYQDGLSRLGYQAQYIEWYTEQVLMEKAEDAAQAEERAQEEALRVQERGIKSAYRVGRADIDLQIAELTRAVTETQIALQSRRRRFERELEVARGFVSDTVLIETSKAEIAELQRQIDAQKQYTAQYQSQIESIETELADKRSDLTTLEADTSDIRHAIEEWTTDIATLKVTLDSVETQIAELKADLAFATTSEDAITYQEQILSLQVEREKIQDDIAEINESIAKGREELARIESRTNVRGLTLKQQIGQLMVDREKVQDKIAEIAEAVASLKGEIAQNEAILRRDLKIVARVTSEAEARESYAEDRSILETQIGEYRTSIEELREDKATLELEYYRELEEV